MCRSLAALIVVATALSFDAAHAGKLDHGSWTPTGCGEEPAAPSGLNLSSKDAYAASIKWAKEYQDAYQKFSDCMIKEADNDVAGINDYVQASQHRAQEFFDKASADNKQANKVLNGNNSSGISLGQRGSRPASGSGPDQ